LIVLALVRSAILSAIGAENGAVWIVCVTVASADATALPGDMGRAGRVATGDDIGCDAAAGAFVGIVSPLRNRVTATYAASPSTASPRAALFGSASHRIRCATQASRHAIRLPGAAGNVSGAASLGGGTAPRHSHKPGSWHSLVTAAVLGGKGSAPVIDGDRPTGAQSIEDLHRNQKNSLEAINICASKHRRASFLYWCKCCIPARVKKSSRVALKDCIVASCVT